MTRIFISWSGEPSLTVAHFLRDWMGNVINAATPWMSGEDIAAGALWSQEVSEALSATDIGVLCVTSRNQRSPWLNFEAGALAKALQQSRVIPYLIGLSAGELEGPLKQFQAVTADKSGSWRLCQSVNEGLGRPLNDKKLELSFGKWWPDLAQVLTDLPEVSEEPALVPGTDQTWPKRKTLDSLEECLRLLSVSQRRLVEAILAATHILHDEAAPVGDSDGGVYLGTLMEKLSKDRPELYYRCKDLERDELVNIQDLTDYYVSPTSSVAKIASQGPERMRAVLHGTYFTDTYRP